MMAEHWRIQPSEIDRLPFFEFYYMEQDLKELLEEKAKANASAQEQSKTDSDMKKQQRAYKPSAMKMPNYKLPKLR